MLICKFAFRTYYSNLSYLSWSHRPHEYHILIFTFSTFYICFKKYPRTWPSCWRAAPRRWCPRRRCTRRGTTPRCPRTSHRCWPATAPPAAAPQTRPVKSKKKTSSANNHTFDCTLLTRSAAPSRIWPIIGSTSRGPRPNLSDRDPATKAYTTVGTCNRIYVDLIQFNNW